MKLSLFNKLDDNRKENNFVQDFIKKLSDYLKNILERGVNEMQNRDDRNSLNKYREEDCLYQVVDFSSNGIFLKNTNNNKVFEETGIPKELLNKIGNDHILRYKDGRYIYEEELTDEFFNKLVSISEYKKIQEDFINKTNILQINSNTIYHIYSREDNYTILNYEGNNKIRVPNALIPYFSNKTSELYYRDGEFKMIKGTSK